MRAELPPVRGPCLLYAGGVSPLFLLRAVPPPSSWAWPPIRGRGPYIRGRSPYYTWARPPLYVGEAPFYLYAARSPYIRGQSPLYVGSAPPIRGRSPLPAVGRVPFPAWASTFVGWGPLLRYVARGRSLRWAVPLSSLRRPSLLSPRAESRCLRGLSRPASTTTAGLEPR